MMGMYWGDSIPPSHASSSNEFLIHFQSDGWGTRAGFQLEYNPIGKQNPPSQNNTEYHRDRYRIALYLRCHVYGDLSMLR